MICKIVVKKGFLISGEGMLVSISSSNKLKQKVPHTHSMICKIVVEEPSSCKKRGDSAGWHPLRNKKCPTQTHSRIGVCQKFLQAKRRNSHSPWRTKKVPRNLPHISGDGMRTSFCKLVSISSSIEQQKLPQTRTLQREKHDLQNLVKRHTYKKLHGLQIKSAKKAS